MRFDLRPRLYVTVLWVAVAFASIAARPADGWAQERQPPPGHRFEVGLYGGRWDFDGDMRFADDAVLGLGIGLQFFPWLNTEVSLDQITTRDRRSRDWVQAVTGGIHARIEPWTEGTIRPGLLLGVAFMVFDEDGRPDALSEGFDAGIGLRWRASRLWTVRGDLLLRYQTVRILPVNENGVVVGDGEDTGYFTSSGLRVGVSIAL